MLNDEIVINQTKVTKMCGQTFYLNNMSIISQSLYSKALKCYAPSLDLRVRERHRGIRANRNLI